MIVPSRRHSWLPFKNTNFFGEFWRSSTSSSQSCRRRRRPETRRSPFSGCRPFIGFRRLSYAPSTGQWRLSIGRAFDTSAKTSKSAPIVIVVVVVVATFRKVADANAARIYYAIVDWRKSPGHAHSVDNDGGGERERERISRAQATPTKSEHSIILQANSISLLSFALTAERSLVLHRRWSLLDRRTAVRQQDPAAERNRPWEGAVVTVDNSRMSGFLRRASDPPSTLSPLSSAVVVCWGSTTDQSTYKRTTGQFKSTSSNQINIRLIRRQITTTVTDAKVVYINIMLLDGRRTKL